MYNYRRDRMVGTLRVPSLGPPTFRKKQKLKKHFDERRKIKIPTFEETSLYWVSD